MPASSPQTAPFEQDMTRALQDALPSIENADDISAQLVNEIEKLAAQFMQTIKNDASAPIEQHAANLVDGISAAANDNKEYADRRAQPNMSQSPDPANNTEAMSENQQDEMPTEDAQPEKTPDGVPSDQTAENPGAPEGEENQNEESPENDEEEEPDQSSHSEEQNTEEQEEQPEQKNEEDPLGFKKPAYHKATEEEDPLAGGNKGGAGSLGSHMTQSKDNAERMKKNKQSTEPSEAGNAADLTAARNKDRQKQANAKGKQDQNQQNQPEMPSNYGYYVILALCFFRDVIWLALFLPLINIVVANVLIPFLFYTIFFLSALIDKKFFMFFIYKLVGGATKSSTVKKQAQKVVVEVGGLILVLVVVIIFFFIWPYTLLLVWFRGKYIEYIAAGNDPKDISFKKIGTEAAANIAGGKKPSSPAPTKKPS